MEEARVKAITEGKTWYSSNWACVHGHVGRRYAVNGACVKCSIESASSSYHAKKGEKDGSGGAAEA